MLLERDEIPYTQPSHPTEAPVTGSKHQCEVSPQGDIFGMFLSFFEEMLPMAIRPSFQWGWGKNF